MVSREAASRRCRSDILKQANGLRDLARRARRLTGTVTDEGDRRRLTRYSEELDESAARQEKSAVSARTG